MNGFVADNILVIAVLDVNLSKVFAVVTLSLWQHSTFFIICELLLKFSSVLVELHI